MRSCAYCGKNLEKGQLCDCPQSINARRAKQGNNNTQSNTGANNSNNASGNASNSSGYASGNAGNANTSQNNAYQGNTYQTGYTKKSKPGFWEKIKQKHATRQAKSNGSSFHKESFRDVAGGLKSFCKGFMTDPINTISNCPMLSPWQIILLIVIESLIISLCGFFANSRILSLIPAGAGLSLANTAYKFQSLLQTALTGTIVLSLGMFLLIGVFFGINKLILKQRTQFWSFSIRLSAAVIPMTILSLAGLLINFFSVYAMVMLNITGIILWIILTYEALRSEWSFISHSRVYYLMGVGFFIFLAICFNILRVVL